jgi:O-antigen/teichoic acid export membrane protein
MQPPTSMQPQATAPKGAIAVSGLSLRHNFAWTLAGNVVYAGCQWGMLIVLAKLGSPIMVGQFALGLAVTAPVIMFTNLDLRTVQATDAKSDFLFGHYLGLRTVTASLALLVIAGITFAGSYRRETALVILTVGLAKTFESFSDVIYGSLQRHERMDRIAISMIIKGPLSLATLGLGVYCTGNVLGGVLGLAVTWGFVLAFYDLRSSALILKNLPDEGAGAIRVKCLYLLWDFKKLCTLLWLALPLGTVALLWSLNANIPRYFIEHYLGERELGIFAALAYLMVAGKTVVSALAQTSIPRLSKYYAIGNWKAFRSLLFRLIAFGALIGGVGLLLTYWAGREILTLLYRPEYAQYYNILFWVMLAAGLNYVATFVLFGLTAARYFKIQTLLHAIISITVTVASYFLIPTLGLMGAAVVLIIANVFELGSAALFMAYALNTGQATGT